MNADAHASKVMTLEAIDAAHRARDPSVAGVAEQLGIDRSGASRMITVACNSGLASKRASEEDQRRVEVEITDAGEELLRSARAWQADIFQALVAEWAVEDIDQFATYLVRLADQILNPKEQA